MFAQFNEEYGVLVDEQGILLPLSNLRWLEEMIAKHREHTSLELEAIGRRTVEENHPNMVHQFNWDYFKES
ncbi:MAG: hypothetical protein P4K98_08780 [Bryobacteraceae bacterium]|nr:hypothetical protein [Bryobacteraceae bacterium]